MKILLTVFVMMGMALAQAQDNREVHLQSGTTLSDRVTAAQTGCATETPCYIVFRRFIPKYENESLPAVCTGCTWIDQRVVVPVPAGDLVGILSKVRGGTGLDNTNVTFPSTGTLTITVASGTSALGTAEIAGGACATVVTSTATGAATTDVIIATPNTRLSQVTGYGVASTLRIDVYPTADTANFEVCNVGTAAVTPGALTFNWRIVR